MLAAIPLGYFGEPADVGWAVRFLASPEAATSPARRSSRRGQVLPESN